MFSKKRAKMKQLIILFILSGVCVQFIWAQNSQVRTQEFSQSELKKQNIKIAAMVVEEISKTLPQKIDKYTTITKMKNDGSTLVYTFEINTGAKSDTTIRKEDHSRMQRAVTEGVCLSSKRFLLAGINITYIYISSKTKKTLFRFEITQDKCRQLDKK